MKVIADLAKRVKKTLAFDIDKAADDGEVRVFVSRPVLNASKWADWATKWGVPNPVPAAEMHVTVMYSKADVKAPLVETAMNVAATRGCFCFFGTDDECVVFTFDSWEMWERNYDLRMAGGADGWPSYRPHLTLSYDAKGWAIPDEAMQDVPGFIVLGGETMVTTKKSDPSDVVDEDDSVITIIEIACSKAQELLKEQGETMPLLAAYDVAEVAKGRATKSVAKRLADADWAPEELRHLVQQQTSNVRKRVEKDYSVTVSAIPEDVTKKLATTEVFKNNDEQQIVMGIASVSTSAGELVTDLHGDQVTTQALVEFNRSLMTGSRAGKFEHSGEVKTEVVAGIVLTDDWQKSLGIELGFEPYLVEIHVPDPKDWAEVKKGDWELSIAGRMWYWQEDADAEI